MSSELVCAGAMNSETVSKADNSGSPGAKTRSPRCAEEHRLESVKRSRAESRCRPAAAKPAQASARRRRLAAKRFQAAAKRRRLAAKHFQAAALLLLLPAISCRFMNMAPLEITDWSPRKHFVSTGETVQVWITFSAPMDRAKAEEAFSLQRDGQPQTGTYQWREETLRFIPHEAIYSGHSYIMTVTTQAEDRYGNSLADDFSFGFQIGSDQTQPSLISCSPSDHEVTDDPHQTVTLSFSEPIDRRSLYEGFSLTPAVDGGFTWSAGDSTVSFTPISRLQWQQEYVVSLSGAVSDLQGNLLDQPHSSRFRVGSDTTPPTVVSLANLDETYLLLPYDDTGGHINEGWESAWGIRMRLSEPVDRDSLEGALAVEPDWDFQIQWPVSTATDEVTLIPDERFRYGELYTLHIRESLSDLYGNPVASEIRYRLLVNGPGSKPPEITRATFLTVPGSVDPGHIVHALDFSLIDISSYGSPALGFFDIYFDLAEGCTADLPSFMRSFSVSRTNSCADLLPIAVEQSPDTALSPSPSPEPGAGQVVVRVYMTIQDNPGNNGVISLELSQDFQDSSGNTLSENWQLMLVK